METFPHCTVSARSAFVNLLRLGLLSFAVLLVHGFHPWAEDGGLYVAGVEFLLRPALFPKETAFVTEHLRFSVFAPLIAGAVRCTHLSLAAVLLAAYLLSAFMTLLAAWQITGLCFHTRAARWSAVGVLAAWWTLPVAGTSLLLMDPYLTARSFSLPLSLLSIASALRWNPPRAQREARQPSTGSARSLLSLLACFLWLALAAAMHPLMAGCALALVAVLLGEKAFGKRAFPFLLLAAFAIAAAVQASSPHESPAVLEAVYSRYYWFLSQWRWYEWLGLVCPLGILLTLVRLKPKALTPGALRLCRATLLQAVGALAIAGCFARVHLNPHPIARLQPLRAFLLVYVVMAMMLGGLLFDLARRTGKAMPRSTSGHWVRSMPVFVPIVLGAIMFHVQRAEFPCSPHVELPGIKNSNPWFQAFVWSRTHTAPDALFALDPRYVNTRGEDAQTFRAISERSAIPDYSKDGGEAAITPELAAEWQRSAAATQSLNQLSDGLRHEELRPFQVQWVILNNSAVSARPCPYRNETVKVCQL